VGPVLEPELAAKAYHGGVAIDPRRGRTQVHELSGLIGKRPNLKSVQKEERDRIDLWERAGGNETRHSLDDDLAPWLKTGDAAHNSFPNGECDNRVLRVQRWLRASEWEALDGVGKSHSCGAGG